MTNPTGVLKIISQKYDREVKPSPAGFVLGNTTESIVVEQPNGSLWEIVVPQGFLSSLNPGTARLNENQVDTSWLEKQ